MLTNSINERLLVLNKGVLDVKLQEDLELFRCKISSYEFFIDFRCLRVKCWRKIECWVICAAFRKSKMIGWYLRSASLNRGASETSSTMSTASSSSELRFSLWLSHLRLFILCWDYYLWIKQAGWVHWVNCFLNTWFLFKVRKIRPRYGELLHELELLFLVEIAVVDY